SGPLSYVGGNVATRASGPHALRHGAINRYVEELRFLTVDGSVVDTRDRKTLPTRLASGLTGLARRIAADPTSVARLEARRAAKWASGYELLALLDYPNDPVRALPRLMTGSVGTLGIVTEIALRSETAPSEKAAVLLRFDASQDACAAAFDLRHTASAVEIVNRSALEIIRAQTDALASDSQSQALLIVEYTGPDASDRARTDARTTTRCYPLSARPELADSAQDIERIWRARKALLPVIRRLADDAGVPYSVVNDVGVEPQRLGELLSGAERIFARHDVNAPIYGHAASGNLHLRPLFKPGDLDTVSAVAAEVYGFVTSLGGTITAEHGMGRLRAPFLTLEWGETIVSYMRDLKSILDPHDTLNPGAMFVPESHDYSVDRWPDAPRL
ncbi:MAG TPA: FAD-binding oxidoreductase, partial [Myxococcota bacterium]|nr:FAD-binding oxidoreductase [Myxococcota bacterium]